MKILYVFTSASNVAGSVQKKVCAQIEALIANGVECRGLFLSTDKIEHAEVYPNIDFVQVPKIQAKYFRFSKQRSAYFNTLLSQKAIDVNGFDYVYFRYPGAHQLLKRWIKNINNKVFFEHVTAETKEIELYKIENPLRFNISSVLSLIEFYYLPLLREKLYGSRIRRAAIFGICNSEDIATYENNAANLNYKTLVLGDAVQTKKFRVKNIAKLENEFRIIFLKGASTSADFNGLDRVFKGIKMYKGLFNIRFYLFGNNLVAEKRLIEQLGIQDYVICSDFIQKEQIDIVIDQMHLGIGALAVHRKGLKSTSTIKTREYFARGLPFLYGHNDVDFLNNSLAQTYCIQLPSNDDPINFEEIINWYLSINFSITIALRMHNSARDNLDYNVKMKKLLDFLNIKHSKII
jgi:hypothetical protein